MVKRILCAIDRSPSSLQAFDYALALARWRKAQLMLLEVAEGTVRPGAPRSAKTPRISTGPRTALEADLYRVLAARRCSDVKVDIVLREGDVVREILAQANASRSDLVVMGTHGPGGVQRPIGSVAEKVLRLAKCPVLTVRRGVKRGNPHGAPFAKILCPTDFSAAANRAMACAERLAKLAGATLIAMSVIDEKRESTSSREGSLARLKARARADGIRVQTLVAFGETTAEIVVHGHERAVDLVVMGISGRGTPEAFALGSTARHVIRKGAWPVLTVRA